MDIGIYLVLSSFLDNNLCYISAVFKLVGNFIFNGNPFNYTSFLDIREDIFEVGEDILLKLRFDHL
jgi:hypothetical protein